MNFKIGDTVTPNGDHEEVIFKIIGKPRIGHYFNGGQDKKWLANGVHIGRRYRGTLTNNFHLENCVMYNPICKFKKLKRFSMTE